jgi:mono/diheme cytochrome c family protein
MKRIVIHGILITIGTVLISCNPNHTGRVYMPDMAYSVAYETYASTEKLKEKGIYYVALPVAGTIARGDSAPYTLPNSDTGYAQSKTVLNPIKSLNADQMKEAERLFLVNCAICHGPKLDGNGPLYNGGNGPFPAAPKDLMSDEIKGRADGTIFHVMTYGKNMMGSYASQLSTNQRWMVLLYIRSKQAGGGATTAKSDSVSTATKKDSTASK